MSFGVPKYEIPKNVRWEPPAPKKVAITTSDYRPCSVDGIKAIFHRWAEKSWVVPPSPLVGGHSGGTVRGVFAIIEMEDGTVYRAQWDDQEGVMTFLDQGGVFTDQTWWGFWKVFNYHVEYISTCVNNGHLYEAASLCQALAVSLEGDPVSEEMWMMHDQILSEAQAYGGEAMWQQLLDNQTGTRISNWEEKVIGYWENQDCDGLVEMACSMYYADEDDLNQMTGHLFECFEMAGRGGNNVAKALMGKCPLLEAYVDEWFYAN